MVNTAVPAAKYAAFHGILGLVRVETGKTSTNGFAIDAQAGYTPGRSGHDVPNSQPSQSAYVATTVENKSVDQSENATAEATHAIIELRVTAEAIAT